MPLQTELAERMEIIINDGSDRDISQFVKTLNFDQEKEISARTSVCNLHEIQDPGVEAVSLAMECFQDYVAANGPHAVFRPLSRNGNTAVLKWKPKKIATATNNKQKQVSVVVLEYAQPGEFGEQAMTNITFGIVGDVTEVTS